MALVEAQDKANKAYPPIPANLATIGETASTTMRGKRVGTWFRPSSLSITDTGQVRMIACLKCKHPGGRKRQAKESASNVTATTEGIIFDVTF